MIISSAGHSFVSPSYVSRAEWHDAERLGAAESQAGAVDKQEQTEQTGVALTAEQIKEIEQLKARDREVRAHEMAHLAAAGGLAMSGATFTYQRGADGASYAIGGEVKIDTSSGSTPEETIRKAQTIRAGPRRTFRSGPCRGCPSLANGSSSSGRAGQPG